jgi:hypothetical protein
MVMYRRMVSANIVNFMTHGVEVLPRPGSNWVYIVFLCKTLKKPSSCMLLMAMYIYNMQIVLSPELEMSLSKSRGLGMKARPNMSIILKMCSRFHTGFDDR